jgi:hypothetical protein
MLIQESHKDVPTKHGGDMRMSFTIQYSSMRLLTATARYLSLPSNYSQLPEGQIPRRSSLQRNLSR